MPSQNRRRILVVDDSRLVRELARVGLETVGGWQVTGPETLAAPRAEPATSEIPVILVTARDQPADRERFEALGVAGVITKPFEVNELAGQGAEILGWES